MDGSEKNWNNLFGEYTTDKTAWHGQWTVYSPNQEVMKSQQVVRSFRSNLDNILITRNNCYIDGYGNVVDEKTWQNSLLTNLDLVQFYQEPKAIFIK